MTDDGDENDDELWASITRHIKKLKKKPMVVPLVPRLPFRQYGRKTPYNETPYTAPPSWMNSSLTIGGSVDIDKSTAEKLKRGKFEIDGKLDLHGYTGADAYRALEQFIKSGFDQGKRCLLIITGKGLRMDGTKGVLRESVPKWLNEPEMRQRILAFRYAKGKDGGEGALYVLLRRKRL